MEKDSNNILRKILEVLVIILVTFLLIIIIYGITGFDLFEFLKIGSVSGFLAKIGTWISSVIVALGGSGLGGNGEGIIPTPTQGITDCSQYNGKDCIYNGYGGKYKDCVGTYPNCQCKCDVPCTAYHIANMFRGHFGNTIINQARTSCQNAGGIWTEAKGEISCVIGHPANINCGSQAMLLNINYCEETLNANYVCDNNNGVYGCFCNVNPPEANSDTWECGTYYESTGVCNGKCPAGLACSLKSGTCGCFTGEEEEEQQCSGAIVPNDVGDKGGWCATRSATCNTVTPNCDNYFDIHTLQHKCGCAKTYFCIQNVVIEQPYPCSCDPISTTWIKDWDGDGVTELKCVV